MKKILDKESGVYTYICDRCGGGTCQTSQTNPEIEKTITEKSGWVLDNPACPDKHYCAKCVKAMRSGQSETGKHIPPMPNTCPPPLEPEDPKAVPPKPEATPAPILRSELPRAKKKGK